ncbi:MAG: PAS domain S-box protein [Saprospiraceae bacterium]|nr:PAS domain S-box protein [Pyrinomonadaceae bacterium]
MLSVDEKDFPANSSRIRSVQTLIIGRLIVVFLLLATTWIWYSGRMDLSFESLPEGPFLIFIISVGLTSVYFLFLRLSRQTAWQIWLQFTLDALLITNLVWLTGDLTSPYITLYIVLISVSSFYLKPLATLFMALICILVFIALAIMTSFAVLEPTGAVQATSKIVQIVSFHVVAFLVVGLLAARLSDRRSSGEKLVEATKSLASLRALHERIIESIRSGLITTDLDGNIYTFNSAATEITGLRSEKMRGEKIFSLFGNIQKQIDLSFAAVAGGEQSPRFEADFKTPDGFAVRIGYSIAQLFSEENEATGLIITFQDLTEIRSMEESARRKDRLAAVGRVGAGLAHEIRNPLGAMRGAIQVLQSSTPPESMQASLMDIILRESDRLNAIITNFLSYAKPKVGNFSEIDVGEAITDTLTLLRHGPDVGLDHKLVEEIPPNPVLISADATQLKQIFWNLARNAIQAMSGSGVLTIRLEPIQNDRIKIVFEDTGQGMSQEAVEQLFEPFANSTSGGTGLGLSIVYQIIRDHNGTINVRSIEGSGTVITVELPRKQRNQAASIEPEPGKDQADASPLTNYLSVKKDESNVSS